MKINSIVFDFDGTIIDSQEGIEFCLRKTLAAYEIPFPNKKNIKTIIGLKLGELFENVIPPEKKEIIPELVAQFRLLYKSEGIKRSKIYQGIPEILAQLRKKKINLYIVTNKPLFFTIMLCKKFKIESFFNGIMGTQLSSVSQSKDEFIRDMKNKNLISEKNSCYVGDMPSDIHLARKHSLYSVGALYGYSKKEDLIKIKPDLLISSFSDLINYL